MVLQQKINKQKVIKQMWKLVKLQQNSNQRKTKKKIKQIMLVDPMNINQIFQTDVLIFGRVQ